MRPLNFPQQNREWAKNQPPYLPLPAYSDTAVTISKWGLTWRERWKIFCTGILWLRQLNFGAPLQSQKPEVDSPFLEEK